jgi:hypothetical protein
MGQACDHLDTTRGRGFQFRGGNCPRLATLSWAVDPDSDTKTMQPNRPSKAEVNEAKRRQAVDVNLRGEDREPTSVWIAIVILAALAIIALIGYVLPR